MLVGEGKLGPARAVHEAIGRLLTTGSEPPEARREAVVHKERREIRKEGVALQSDIL